MRVGTSTCTDLQLMREQDHPHACGDKEAMLTSTPATLGSSPCVWGQDKVEFLGHIKLRIIPMRVGTSLLRPPTNKCHWDHPHACGDKTTVTLGLNLTAGSSPCVWGQVCFFKKTYNLLEDHPHACGDKCGMRFLQAFALGSSPCVWGQGEFPRLLQSILGIIPMRVGTRLSKTKTT